MITTTSLLSVTEAAERRRSIRSFEPDAIPQDDLNQILDVVRLAPSAFNIQPWRFAVVQTPEIKAKLAAAAFNQRQVSSAPAVIVLYTDMADSLRRVDDLLHPNMSAEQKAAAKATILAHFGKQTEDQQESWAASTGNIALGYLLLAIESHGYQSSPMAGFDAEQVKTLLNLPANARVPAIVAVGIGTEDGFEHHRHTAETITRFV
ncbi:MAG: nitroreductase family protein [Gemmatimonadota bacterium]|nr:nitroreductase family protein [Gemmatimonadota bacterium]